MSEIVEVIEIGTEPVAELLELAPDEGDSLAGAVILSVDAPAPVGEGGRLSYRHQQPLPADSWLIFHDLPFTPSGIDPRGEQGQRLYPLRVVHTAPGRTRLDFPYAVGPGTADLS